MSRARLFDTVLDATGRPIVGASVAVYQPNTATPISETLYADDIGGTTLTNPLATGADGSFLAYLDAPCRVDLFISAVGITSRTVPDVGLFPDPADFTTDTDLGNHTGAADPHTGYVLDADLSAHAGAADPHTGYQRESEKDQLSGYPGLTGAGFVLPGQLGSGTPNGTKYLRDDGVWNLPPGVSPTTTRGDLIYRNATVDARLAIGTIGQGLTVVDIGAGVLEPRYAGKASGFAVGSTSSPTTTSTTYVDLTDMSVTVTISSGILFAWFEGTFQNNTLAAVVTAALSLDAAAEVGAGSVNAPVAAYNFHNGLCYRWSGLSAASHTVKVRWKVSGGTGLALTTERHLLLVEG